MRNLNYELKQLCRRNRDGSYATQRDRERVLDLVANQLHELGYRHLVAASLKPKHVEGLVERWQAEGLAVGTIKNRMAELRWWAEKIGKQNVIARDNDHYLTARCVVWDLAEVMSWLQRRRQDGYSGVKKAPMPDVRKRMRRPIGAKG